VFHFSIYFRSARAESVSGEVEDLQFPLSTLQTIFSPPLWGAFFNGGSMRPVQRKHVDKGRSAKQFRGNVSHTKAANLKTPMRGGWRL